MEPVPIFLNEASYPLGVEDERAGEVILKLLQTLRDIKSLPRAFVLGSAVRLWDVPLTNAYRTLASFAGIVDKEWKRFVVGLDQHFPFAEVPMCMMPEQSEHVLEPRNDVCAALWAKANNSFLLSFPGMEKWQSHLALFSVCDCLDGLHQFRSIECRNLSGPEHVIHWRSALLDYGLVDAASSVIYETATLRLRMYLNDHDPPHLHVYLPGSQKRWVAKVRIDHVEVMEDRGLGGSVKREVLTVIANKQEELMRAWERCRGGHLPNSI